MSGLVGKTSWGYVWGQTFSSFREQFRDYFPSVLLACACVYVCNDALQWISNQLLVPPSYESIMEPAGFMGQRFIYGIGRISIWSIQLWLVFMVFSFVLGSFAAKMLHERQRTGTQMRIGEAFRLVRSGRPGPLVGLSAVAGAATGLFSTFLVPLLLRPLPLLLIQLHLLDSYFVAVKCAEAALLLLLVALMTKMALAIPELVDDPNVSVGESIRNSIKATAGWELFFVLEFGIFGLIGGALYSAGKELLDQSWRHEQLTSTGHGILLAAFTAVIAALSLTLLAITYSVLYVALRYGDAPPLSETANA